MDPFLVYGHLLQKQLYNVKTLFAFSPSGINPLLKVQTNTTNPSKQTIRGILSPSGLISLTTEKQ